MWPAKVSLRSTIIQPTSAASTATIAAGEQRVDHEVVFEHLADVVGEFQLERRAASESTGMGVSMVVAVVVVGGRLGLADHDEPAVGGPQHLDRQRRRAR